MKFDSEAGILEERDERRQQAAQMKLLKTFVKNYYIRSERKSIRSGETWSAGHCSGNRTLSKKVATTHTQNGQKLDTRAGTAVLTAKQDDREKDGGTNFILRVKEQATRLTF